MLNFIYAETIFPHCYHKNGKKCIEQENSLDKTIRNYCILGARSIDLQQINKKKYIITIQQTQYMKLGPQNTS